VAATAGTDAAPIFGVLFEVVTLVWIDLVGDKAGDGHGSLLVGARMG
jgi:hypothetical protein